MGGKEINFVLRKLSDLDENSSRGQYLNFSFDLGRIGHSSEKWPTSTDFLGDDALIFILVSCLRT
jgi:hypothetical protein